MCVILKMDGKGGYKKKTRRNKKKKLSKADRAKIWNNFAIDCNLETTDKKQEEFICTYTENDAGIRDFCDICNERVSMSEQKYLICTNPKCGVIYKDVLDDSPEWRYYGADDNKSVNPTRCGMPINPLLKESSFGCKVYCNSRSSWEMKKVRRYTEWQSMPYKEKAQYEEYQKIKTLSHNAGIPKIIVDDALRYHQKISEHKTFRGCNRNGVIAASIYISCKINKYPRTAKEIAIIFKLDITAATKGCKNAVQILNNIEREDIGVDKTHFCEIRIIDFIERYCSKLNINKELTKLCQFIALRLEQKDAIPENTPHSVAAGIVYFIAQTCKLNVSKKDVAGYSNISEVTINKCYKKLEKIKGQFLPPSVVNKYNN